MVLVAVDAPTEPEPEVPPLVLNAAAMATPPASALIFDASLALSMTSWPVPRVVTTLAPVMLASMVCWMVFTEPAPAPASPPVRPLPVEPDTEGDPLLVRESIVGEDVSLRV